MTPRRCASGSIMWRVCRRSRRQKLSLPRRVTPKRPGGRSNDFSCSRPPHVYHDLLYIGKIHAKLLVRRPFFVIDFDELTADDALRVDDVRCRVGPTAPVRIEYAVAIDYFVVSVFQQWKVELSFKTNLHHFCEFLRVFMAVDTDRDDLDFLLLLFRQ